MRAGVRSYRGNHRGSTPLIGLLIGISIFMVAFYVVVQTAVKRDADITRAEGASISAQAVGLANVLLGSGAGWFDGPACKTVSGVPVVNKDKFEPDRVGAAGGRFGLGDDACGRDSTDPRGRNNLSYDKLGSLFGASLQADSDNGKVDYAEARLSLGMSGLGLDFHLRSWPVLASTRQLLDGGQLDPYARPLYIGDYHSTGAPAKTVQHTAGVIDGADQVVIYLDITNNGTAATIFANLFSIPLDRRSVDFTLHTPLLAPGQSYNTTVTIRKTSDWAWDNPANRNIAYTIQDKDGALQSGAIALAGITMTYSSSRLNVFPESDQMYWVSAGGAPVTARLNYGAYRGDGTDQPFSDWTLSTLSPLGLPLPPIVLPNDDQGVVSQSLVLVGAHKGRVQNDLLSLTWNLDNLNVVTAAPSAFMTGGASGFVPSEAAVTESQFVDRIILAFDRNVFSAPYAHASLPSAAGGDVYPDVKEVLNNDVKDALTDATGAPSLARYNLLVVGSNVDHNAMTSAAAKYAIRDWVLAGGTLIAFGSDQQNVNWLQPLFHASLETAGGGLYTPDATHPALRVPNQLDYPAFLYTTTWGYTAGAETSFTHIVQSGSADVLAYGNPGAFGEGRVILTSWRPYALVPGQASTCDNPDPAGPDCQALNLVHNLLTLSYRTLYLDYGPPVPADAAVGSHIRILSVYHPELRQLVTIELQVLAFGGGS